MLNPLCIVKCFFSSRSKCWHSALLGLIVALEGESLALSRCFWTLFNFMAFLSRQRWRPATPLLSTLKERHLGSLKQETFKDRWNLFLEGSPHCFPLIHFQSITHVEISYIVYANSNASKYTCVSAWCSTYVCICLAQTYLQAELCVSTVAVFWCPQCECSLCSAVLLILYCLVPAIISLKVRG